MSQEPGHVGLSWAPLIEHYIDDILRGQPWRHRMSPMSRVPTGVALTFYQQGNEFVHLPRIVETAESSPAAAKEAAHRIRKYLVVPSTIPSHVQYNAIMLMRILVDNPGPTFTRNFDSKFVATIKDVLRYGRDWHVQHCLRQYLNHLEVNKPSEENLQPLLQMWAKEKVKSNGSYVSLCG